MGRTTKDRHDLDYDDVEFDDVEDDLELLFSSKLTPKRRAKRAKKKSRSLDESLGPNRLPSDHDDWRDPEDDIMYGFSE